MPMFIRSHHYVPQPPNHPTVIAIKNLPINDIAHQWNQFHTALQADGYRLGIKYLDCGVYIPQSPNLRPRSAKATKDPIHKFFPQYKPQPHPYNEKYPTPPISAEDVKKCLPGLQIRQHQFALFDRQDENWKALGWPSRTDPFQFSWHSSNLYVTPLSSKYYFLSIDDVNTPDKIERLKELGIQPALICVSSIDPDTKYENQQWTLKIPKLHQYQQPSNLIDHFARHLCKPVDDDAIKLLAQDLNKIAGDSDVKNCTRDFRLPGFFQLKKKYVENNIFHQVSIKLSENHTCGVAEAMYHAFHETIRKKATKRTKPLRIQAKLPLNKTHNTLSPSSSLETGVLAPAHLNHQSDFYPNNEKYMAHAQAIEDFSKHYTPGTHQSKYRVLQRLIVTGSLEGIDCKTPLFHDAYKYLSENVKSHLYIYLRIESQINNYHDETPIQPESFNAHYANAYQYFEDHKKSVQAACRRMFYCRHSRDCIERTLIYEGCEPNQALEHAKKGCCPSNQQIKKDSSHLSVWEKIEKAAARNRQEAKVTRCVPKIKAQ